jgi:hypothetical protein
MGAVFLAEHTATGGRYALKGILDASDPELVQRFLREGEAQAAVDDHPNVLRVHACDRHQGLPYLVMEVAEGGSLEDRLKQGPLPAQEAAAVVRELARGLQHVHVRGILHRDLKPSNVLFDERGTPKLVDFGIARIDQAERLTRTGAAVGTPSYMSPEQASGVREEVGVRSDVYGLGAVLYHALTGKPPFAAATMLGTLAQVMKDAPVPPTKLAVGIPAALEAVCLRALSKEPQARFASARDLAVALDEALAAPDAAGPVWRPRLLALVVALALAGLGFLLTASPSPSDQAAVPEGVASPSDRAAATLDAWALGFGAPLTASQLPELRRVAAEAKDETLAARLDAAELLLAHDAGARVEVPPATAPAPVQAAATVILVDRHELKQAARRAAHSDDPLAELYLTSALWWRSPGGEVSAERLVRALSAAGSPADAVGERSLRRALAELAKLPEERRRAATRSVLSGLAAWPSLGELANEAVWAEVEAAALEWNAGAGRPRGPGREATRADLLQLEEDARRLTGVGGGEGLRVFLREIELNRQAVGRRQALQFLLAAMARGYDLRTGQGRRKAFSLNAIHEVVGSDEEALANLAAAEKRLPDNPALALCRTAALLRGEDPNSLNQILKPAGVREQALALLQRALAEPTPEVAAGFRGRGGFAWLRVAARGDAPSQADADAFWRALPLALGGLQAQKDLETLTESLEVLSAARDRFPPRDDDERALLREVAALSFRFAGETLRRTNELQGEKRAGFAGFAGQGFLAHARALAAAGASPAEVRAALTEGLPQEPVAAGRWAHAAPGAPERLAAGFVPSALTAAAALSTSADAPWNRDRLQSVALLGDGPSPTRSLPPFHPSGPVEDPAEAAMRLRVGLASGEPVETLEPYLDQAMAANPGDLSLLYQACAVLMAAERPAEVVKVAAPGTLRHGDQPLLLLRAAEAHASTGKLHRTLEHLRTLGEVDPPALEAVRLHARVFWKRKRGDEAKQVLERILPPKSCHDLVRLWSTRRAGNWTAARRILRRLDTDHPLLVAEPLWVDFEAGDAPGEVLGRLEQVLPWHPSNPWLLELRVRLTRAAGDERGARAALADWLLRRPEDAPPAELYGR